MTETNKVKNDAQIAKGKMTEAAGKVTGDEHLQDKGKADQIKGNLKQAVEKVKDAANSAT